MTFQKKRIIHFTRQFHPAMGGVESFVAGLAKYQFEAGHNVSIVTLNRDFSNNTRLPPFDKYYGIPIVRLSFWGGRRYFFAFACWKYLKSSDILHIHCVDFFVDFLSLTKFLHKKHIILHTHGGYFHTKWFLWLKNIYFYIVTRNILRVCNKIIADSENDYRIFSKICSQVIKIDNGVDIKRFSSIVKSINKNCLLYIGRIDAHKRVDLLVKLVAALKKRGEIVSLAIVGPHWDKTIYQLRGLARTLGVEDLISFVGSVSDQEVANYLQKCHIFLSASQYEGFGISAVEAMASGTLCVLNKICSFENIIRHGKNGFLVEFENLGETASCVYNLLMLDEKDYLRLTAEAQKDVSRYSWDKVGEQITDIYYQ